MDDFDVELKAGFLEEAAQSVADAEQCFLALEQNPGDQENLNKIFRVAHNLKGSSKAVGFDDMGSFTHAFESFILKIKNGELAPSPAAVTLLLRANDHVRSMIEQYKSDLNAKIDSSELLACFENFSAEPAALVPEPQPAEPTPVVEEAHEVSEPEPVHLEANSALSEPEPQQQPEMNHEPAVVTSPEPIRPAADSQPSPKGPSRAVTEESIRVSLTKVQRLVDYIGELVILQNVLKEQTQDFSSPLLRKSFSQLEKVGKEIQDLAMGLRMVPIKPTFQKMQRIVRDTAQALNKDVVIQLGGEETEIDKTILDMINDPLVHLVRNSVDHGIENKDLRISRGKPERGTVHLIAAHRAGRLIIEVRDDGGGLDAERLKKKATEKGILKPGAVLSEKEAFQLIFAPGFSTKEQVTDISGRGVGMDVVRTNITELGGEIEVESSLGFGTTFRISLPLTLAIIDAMILSFNQQRYVLPLSHVHETLQPKKEAIQQSSILGDVIVLRGENLPIYRLGDFFGLKNTTPLEQMTALVIRSTKQPFIIMVDQILGQQQVVIKQLGATLSSLKGASGITILGDGRPAIIIEPSDLSKRKPNGAQAQGAAA